MIWREYESGWTYKALALQVLWIVLLTMLPWALLSANDEDDDDAKPRLTPAQAQARFAQVMQAGPSDKGADSCLKCHDEENEYPVFPIFRTRHANAMDARTPFAKSQCETCHGPGGEHQKRARGDEEKAPILNFGQKAWTPIAEQNAVCLTCHSNHQRVQWFGSQHEREDIACAACHQIHVEHDPVQRRGQQDEICFTCHRQQQAKFMLHSRHPVREGRMQCSDCHNVHADNDASLQLASSVREQCTSCHAEKRGPFLWEHLPAAEDCRLCHAPHGSANPSLLKKRPPQLCQQCHAQAGHPSVSYNGTRVSSVFLAVKGCSNCHVNSHGSNHPSGATPLR